MRKLSILILLFSNFSIWTQNSQHASRNDVIKKNEIIILNAKEIGLDSITTASIFSLIEKRKKSLQSLINQKDKVSDISQLFESTDLKTKAEIKQEFSRDLAKLISKKEFSKLFGYVFMKNVKKKSISKVKKMKKIEQLSKEQEKEITSLIETYYFNKEVISAYYAFDKKLKRQKLSALYFRFEERYKELREKLNLEVKSIIKVDNRTYLWKN